MTCSSCNDQVNNIILTQFCCSFHPRNRPNTSNPPYHFTYDRRYVVGSWYTIRKTAIDDTLKTAIHVVNYSGLCQSLNSSSWVESSEPTYCNISALNNWLEHMQQTLDIHCTILQDSDGIGLNTMYKYWSVWSHFFLPFPRVFPYFSYDLSTPSSTRPCIHNL